MSNVLNWEAVNGTERAEDRRVRLTLYVSAPSASSSSSSLALKCIFLNSRLLIDGQDDDAGGRSLEGREHLLQARVARHEHPSPGSGPPPPHHGSVLPTSVMEGERKDSGLKAKASPANAGELPRGPQTTAMTSHPVAGSRLTSASPPTPALATATVLSSVRGMPHISNRSVLSSRVRAYCV